MKKLLKNSAIFISLAFAGYVLAICFLGEVFPKQFRTSICYRRCGGGHLFSRMQEVKQVKEVDILFIGTSHCYRGFDTRIFGNAGYRSFNMGSSIQTALQTKALLEKYVDDLNPKLIVYEVNPVAFCSDGVESSVDLISNDVVDMETIAMAFNVNNIKTYNTLIFAIYRQLTGFGKARTELRKYYDDTYIPGGFVENKLKFYKENESFPKTSYKFKDKQFEAFEEILATLKNKNIPFVLVQAPVTKGLYQSKINNRIFDSIMRSKGRYYNFNELVRLTDTLDFYDDNHLNQNGVTIFNNGLLDMIKKDRLLQ